MNFLITKHELSEEGVPKRKARSGHEIAADILAGTDLPQRCQAHGTPGCKPCIDIAALQKYYAEHPEALTKNQPTKTASPRAWGPPRFVVKLPSLEDEVKQLLEKKRLAKLAKHPPKPDHEIRRERQQAWVKKTYDKHSLRHLHGYSPRQLVALFDSPGFNSDPAGTAHYGRNSRPSRPFTLGQLDFYRDYARGKLSRKILDQRVADGHYGRLGFEPVDYLKRLEDDLVNRAWFLGLLNPNKTVNPPIDNSAESVSLSDETEIKVIGLGGSNLTIIGSKWKDTPGKTFERKGLNSFEIGYHTRRVPGPGESEREGPKEEDQETEEEISEEVFEPVDSYGEKTDDEGI